MKINRLIIKCKGNDKKRCETAAADRTAKAAAGYQEVSFNMIQTSSDPPLPTITVEGLKHCRGQQEQQTWKEKGVMEKGHGGIPVLPAELAA